MISARRHGEELFTMEVTKDTEGNSAFHVVPLFHNDVL
jgi:hypothetical protein